MEVTDPIRTVSLVGREPEGNESLQNRRSKSRGRDGVCPEGSPPWAGLPTAWKAERESSDGGPRPLYPRPSATRPILLLPHHTHARGHARQLTQDSPTHLAQLPSDHPSGLRATHVGCVKRAEQGGGSQKQDQSLWGGELWSPEYPEYGWGVSTVKGQGRTL